MSKPQLHDLPAKYQEQAVKQLYATPRPKTTHVEPDGPVKPAKKKRAPSYDKERAVSYFGAVLSSAPVAEYRFHPTRKWRFDFAFPSSNVALEVEGGVWTGGRHTRGSGFVGDMKKYNAAACRGWRVIKCVPADLYKPETVQMLREAIAI